ncbi:carbohydrate-binding module family 14 protein [Streptomyces sp. UNOB3_S3]|uniref:carbohydrate-binding module family 14 protein n=1 Tax=Streptomyces sp. UNOB3_S3 TaxID=2871682 RepID=UPI001E3D438F|nr:carbohydrate-binding module family 14 protein [Streptomyces sp. UNOB3_S3]MCC3779799.1 carbohydrate-binding module family 14 protein [Streptomyces sp. UNOB3_S3]
MPAHAAGGTGAAAEGTGLCPVVIGVEGARLPDGSDPSRYYSCYKGIRYDKTCPEGSVWDATDKQCAAADKAHVTATSLKAGEAKLTRTPLGVKGLNAKVTFGGRYLPGASVTFATLDGTTLCTARTGLLGTTSCDAEGVSVTADQLLRGYTATYNGISTLTGSTGKGAVVAS